jgi:hypothetical protein
MKSITRLPALLLAAAVLLPALAGAETVNTAAELAGHEKIDNYIYSRDMLTELSRLGQVQDEKFGLDYRCKTATDTIRPINLIVITPIDLPEGATHPVKGAWLLRYGFTRCGNEKIYNAVFVASQNGGKPVVQPYYPGAPRAGPTLIKDAMPAALASAKQRAEDSACKEFAVFDMSVAEPPHDVVEQGVTSSGVWKEIWTFRACGNPVEVPVRFVPNAKLGGTGYIIDPLKSR